MYLKRLLTSWHECAGTFVVKEVWRLENQMLLVNALRLKRRGLMCGYSDNTQEFEHKYKCTDSVHIYMYMCVHAYQLVQ